MYQNSHKDNNKYISDNRNKFKNKTAAVLGNTFEKLDDCHLSKIIKTKLLIGLFRYCYQVYIFLVLSNLSRPLQLLHLS